MPNDRRPLGRFLTITRTSNMFAIVGAAGKVGYSTSLALRKAGLPVRAILRDEGKGQLAASATIGCEIALADLRDPAALARSIAGADAVQVILPPPLRAEDAVGEMRQSIEGLAEALGQARPKTSAGNFRLRRSYRRRRRNAHYVPGVRGAASPTRCPQDLPAIGPNIWKDGASSFRSPLRQLPCRAFTTRST